MSYAVKITKKEPASQGQGRGMDGRYTPAQYYVMRDGKPVGVIWGSERSRSSSPVWEVFEYQTEKKSGEVTSLKYLKRFYTFSSARAGRFEGAPFTRAKEFALEYFG